MEKFKIEASKPKRTVPTIRLEENTHEAIKVLARINNITMNELCAQMIEWAARQIAEEHKDQLKGYIKKDLANDSTGD